jgi:inhibitor of KinA sporulation pathway (predicted exonuclease)
MRFVAIDFEATCDEPYNPSPQEVIEFPAVLVAPGDPRDGAEFHSFVRPVAHPHLTAFCRDLTGIAQGEVDAAPTFPEVLSHFDEWHQEYADGALAVTCGDWDLASLLPRQCGQHGLSLPEWARRWANLKTVYARAMSGAADRVGLAEMAARLGVSMVGRLHSGIDDARNIARVLRALLDRGARVTSGSSAPPREELKPGDWLCAVPGCGSHNFAHRDRCYDCGAQRTGLVMTAAGVMRRGDWLCPQCGEHNFARRDVCFGCRRKR